MGRNGSLLAAIVLVLVVPAALGGEATRVLNPTYKTGEGNSESQVTPDNYPWEGGPTGFMVSGADDEG
ncbi:uncharacterized protein J3R85_013312 [Psidium guajava]|nr:uncharacterized protein J3R85_013312 [Psidium guajava]